MSYNLIPSLPPIPIHIHSLIIILLTVVFVLSCYAILKLYLWVCKEAKRESMNCYYDFCQLVIALANYIEDIDKQLSDSLKNTVLGDNSHVLKSYREYAVIRNIIDKVFDTYPELRDDVHFTVIFSCFKRAVKRYLGDKKASDKAVEAYNELLEQFPIRWIAKLFRFKKQGLDRL